MSSFYIILFILMLYDVFFFFTRRFAEPVAAVALHICSCQVDLQP